MREKLLSFLGQLGKECRVSKTGSKILETLWDLARYTGLPCHLVERALDEHLSVLAEIPNKEQLRKTYVLRCIDDLKKGNQVKFFKNQNYFMFIYLINQLPMLYFCRVHSHCFVIC
jgi:hypothetical protein